MGKEMSVGSREELRVKELMITVSRELGISTYMASVILDTLYEKGHITKAERDEYR